MEYEGDFFAALYPVDAPVCLAQMLNDERLVPLDEDLETDAMIEAATKACAQNEIELLQTPVVLTARGPGLENPEAFNEALEYAENGEEGRRTRELPGSGDDEQATSSTPSDSTSSRVSRSKLGIAS